MGSEKKITYLDGIRGVAAIIVIFSHVLLWFNPYLHNGPTAGNIPGEISQWLFNSPLTFFYKGNAAVWLFFVLSGFVLTHSLIKRKDNIEAIRIASSKRYFRLGIPVLASVLICYTLMSSGAFKAKALGATDPFNLAYTFEPSAWEALKQGLWGAMLFGDSSYNYVLWTISIELYGSLLIFGTIALFGKRTASLRAAAIILIACLLPSFEKSYSSMALFAAGMLIATFRIKETKSIAWTAAGALLLLAGLYLFGYHPYSKSYESLVEFAHFFETQTGAKLNWPVFYPQLGSILFLLCILLNANLFRPLNALFFQWLGKISFSVYLLHSFVISILAPYIAEQFSGMTAAAICLALTIPATMCVAHIFYIYIDKYFTELINQLFNPRKQSLSLDIAAMST